jgi:hypothetical protein
MGYSAGAATGNTKLRDGVPVASLVDLGPAAAKKKEVRAGEHAVKSTHWREWRNAKL